MSEVTDQSGGFTSCNTDVRRVSYSVKRCLLLTSFPASDTPESFVGGPGSPGLSSPGDLGLSAPGSVQVICFTRSCDFSDPQVPLLHSRDNNPSSPFSEAAMFVSHGPVTSWRAQWLQTPCLQQNTHEITNRLHPGVSYTGALQRSRVLLVQ